MSDDSSRLEVIEDASPYSEFCLEMECAAAETYLRFVYDDMAQAVAIQRFLAAKGLLESSPPFGRVLLRDGQPIGMVSGVPGPELRALRMKSAIVMRKSSALRLDALTQNRIQLAHQVLFSPRDADYYSSKLAISPAARRTGAGPLLMSFITDEARKRGFERIIGEVHPDNTAMLRVMCEKVGWERLDERRVEDPATRRSLAYVHVARSF
jgi:ribosomal protein S18 acetylase RimI-like enzyme